MDELYNWVWHHLIGRVDGPLKFRLILQPIVATIFAIRAGLLDALDAITVQRRRVGAAIRHSIRRTSYGDYIARCGDWVA